MAGACEAQVQIKRTDQLYDMSSTMACVNGFDPSDSYGFTILFG